MADNEGAQRLKSSLPLQVLLYFHKPFLYGFFAVNMILFLYKGFAFPYPSARLAIEVAIMILLLPLESARLYVAVVLAVVPILLNLYYFRLQVYVLRLDQILNAISFIFVAFEVIFGIFAAISFNRFS